MAQFLYANNYRMAANANEIIVEFFTLVPVMDETGTVQRHEAVGESIRIAMVSQLASSLAGAIQNALSPSVTVEEQTDG